MRRFAMVLSIIVAGVGVSVAAGDAKEELKGTWRVVSAIRDGDKLTDEQVKGVTLTFDVTGRALVKKSDQVLFDGTFKIDPTKKPKTEDATQTSEGENKGKTTLRIYEIEGDTLKICSAEPGKEPAHRVFVKARHRPFSQTVQAGKEIGRATALVSHLLRRSTTNGRK